MKHGVFFLALLVVSGLFGMDGNKKLPLDVLAKNFKSYQEGQLAEHLKGREKVAKRFAEDKIEEIEQSTYLPKLWAYSGLALVGTGLSAYGIYHVAKNAMCLLATYTLQTGPSVEGFKPLYYTGFGILAALGAVSTTIGGIGAGIGLYNIPKYLPEAFEKRKKQEKKHYEDFKSEVSKLPKD